MPSKVQTIRGHEAIELAAEVSGNAAGLPVLLAHGSGQTRRAWKRVTGALTSSGFRVIALDLRGHGDSAWSEFGSYDLRDFASDLVAIATQLERKPAVVGASLGGLAGMIAEGELAAGSFASLTLVDIAPRMETSGVMRVMGFMEKHIDRGFASPEEAAETIASYMPHRKKRGAGGNLKHYLRQKEDGRFYWHWDPKFIRNIMNEQRLDAKNQERQFDALSRATANLSLPLHLVRGGSSDLVSEDSVAHLRELVPHAEYTDIAGATHMVVGDSNDAFSAAIVDFLKRHHDMEANAT
ncbi:MAG: alpha/beta hydrolase [Erythrobacter sp.]